MNIHDITIFIHEETPHTHISKLEPKSDTVVLKISSGNKYYSKPAIVFFLDSPQQLITIKNRLNSEFDRFMKKEFPNG